MAAALAAPFVARPAAAEPKALRFGFQKGEPVLMAARANGDFEKLFGPRGIRLDWVEFQFGPPLLEAMRVGGIDVGVVGDTPPIFAQAARGDLLYIAAGRGAPQSVLLPAGSAVQTLQDLKGKKLAFARGSSAHNFTLLLLEKAGLHYADIEPVYLGPADAGAAFSQGAIDAWTVWEPYASLFNNRPGVRTLITNRETAEQFAYVMGNGGFVRQNPALADAVVQAIAAEGEKARGEKDKIAALLAAATGISQDVWSRALVNHPLEFIRLNDDLLRSQQQIADRFKTQGLIPVNIKVADAFWRPTA